MAEDASLFAGIAGLSCVQLFLLAVLSSLHKYNISWPAAALSPAQTVLISLPGARKYQVSKLC